MTTRDGWTDERIALLKELWPQGLSASKCSKRIGGGLSRSAILGKVNRLGIMRVAPSAPAMTPVKPPAPKQRGPAPRSTPLPVPAEERTTAPRPQAPLILHDDIGVPRVLAKDFIGGCKWPIGDPRAEDFGFCGEPRASGHPVYCADHKAVSIDKRQPKTRVERLAIGSDRSIIHKKTGG